MSTTSRGPSRRTLVKGAAWSVPVVAVAGTAPAHAASPGSVTLIQTGACKSPGQSCSSFPFGYIFTFSSVNTWPCDVTVTNVTIEILTGSAPGTLSVETPITIPAGEAPTFQVVVESTNSANATFTAQLCFTYEVPCREVGAQEDCTIITIAGTPPDCDCPDGVSTTELEEPAADLEAEVVEPAAETESAPAQDTARVAEPAPPVEETTPVQPSTDEASSTAQP